MRLIDAHAAPPRCAPLTAGLRARVLAGAEPPSRTRRGLAEIDVAPGRSLPVHGEDDAETMLYVVRGRARVVAGDGSAAVRGGDVVHLCDRDRVAVTNLGVDTLRLLVVACPGGFERRLRSWEPVRAPAPIGAEAPRALLDLTLLPRAQRHRTVVAALEALDLGTRLVVINDRDPRALQRRLVRRYGDRLGWEPREDSGDRVAVAIWLDPDDLLGSGGRELSVGDLAPAA